MSQPAKIIIGVVVIVLIGGGIYYYLGRSHGVQAPVGGNEAAAQVDDSTALPSGSDTSDASLSQDLSAINAQMQAADADVANVDESVNASTL
jgi:hypothetical protein